MYSIVVVFFSSFLFCKVMLQHVFNNHNNINMNDIQNSNNYSHIITLPRQCFSHASTCVLVLHKNFCFALLRLDCLFTLAYTRYTSKRPGRVRLCHACPGTVTRRCQRKCSQSAAGKSRVCNSIKKELEGLFFLGWGCSMCDGGWGLVCPEAHEAAAADGYAAPRAGDGSVLLYCNCTREAIGNARHSRPRPPSHIRNTYFSRTAWTSIPEEFHLQVGANESEHGARRGR